MLNGAICFMEYGNAEVNDCNMDDGIADFSYDARSFIGNEEVFIDASSFMLCYVMFFFVENRNVLVFDDMSFMDNCNSVSCDNARSLMQNGC